YQLWHDRRDRRSRAEPAFYAVIPAWFFTQAAVCLSRILFRAADLSTASLFFKGLLKSPGTERVEAPPLVWMAVFFFVVEHVAGWMSERDSGLKRRIPVPLQAIAYAAMIVVLFHARIENAGPFIYFKF